MRQGRQRSLLAAPRTALYPTDAYVCVCVCVGGGGRVGAGRGKEAIQQARPSSPHGRGSLVQGPRQVGSPHRLASWRQHCRSSARALLLPGCRDGGLGVALCPARSCCLPLAALAGQLRERRHRVAVRVPAARRRLQRAARGGRQAAEAAPRLARQHAVRRAAVAGAADGCCALCRHGGGCPARSRRGGADRADAGLHLPGSQGGPAVQPAQGAAAVAQRVVRAGVLHAPASGQASAAGQPVSSWKRQCCLCAAGLKWRALGDVLRHVEREGGRRHLRARRLQRACGARWARGGQGRQRYNRRQQELLLLVIGFCSVTGQQGRASA